MRSQGRLSPRDESGTRPLARSEGRPPPPGTAALDARSPRRRGQDAPIRRQAPAPMTSFGSGTSISPSVAPHRPAHGPRRGPILHLACRNLQTPTGRAYVARRRSRAAALRHSCALAEAHRATRPDSEPRTTRITSSSTRLGAPSAALRAAPRPGSPRRGSVAPRPRLRRARRSAWRARGAPRRPPPRQSGSMARGRSLSGAG
jgi:hypothetical protein